MGKGMLQWTMGKWENGKNTSKFDTKWAKFESLTITSIRINRAFSTLAQL